MASWLQNQFKKAEELFEAVDQTAKNVTVPKDAKRTGKGQAGLMQSGPSGRIWINKDEAPRTSRPGSQPVSRNNSFQKAPTESDVDEVKGSERGSQAASDAEEVVSGNERSSDGIEEKGLLFHGPKVEQGEGNEVTPKSTLAVDPQKDETNEVNTSSSLEFNGHVQPESGPHALVSRDTDANAEGASEFDNGVRQTEVETSTPTTADGSQKPESTAGDSGPEAAQSDDQSQKRPHVDQVQGLLKKQPTSKQTKEERLTKICEKLQKRVAEYKKENEQLEEMVEQLREQQGSFQADMQRLQQEVSTAQAGVGAAESSLSTALAAKNTELENLTVALEGAKRQAAMAEGKLAALQANSEALTRGRDMTEAKMLQALREELTLAERRLDDERAAHTATRQAAAARETELENSMTESTTALARMQRTVDERNQKVADMEQKVSMLEVECSTLNQELQDAESKMRREFTRANSVESDAQSQQLNAWKEEADKARRAQREAESKLDTLEAEVQKLRVEAATLRREQDSSSAQAQAALEKRFRELTELLYSKQTQLEVLSSEKAAAILQYEKETRRFQEYKAQSERERNLRSRQSMMAEEDAGDMRSLELSLAHYDIKLGKVNANSIRTAAQFLDFGTISAGRFLWRRPLARLGFLFYLLCLHGFIMYLLHRLQLQAERSLAYGAQDYAAAAGLVKPTLSNGDSLPGR